TIASRPLKFAKTDTFQPVAHYQPCQARETERHNAYKQVRSQPWQMKDASVCDSIKCASSKNPTGMQANRQPKRAGQHAGVPQNQAEDKSCKECPNPPVEI